MTAARYNITIQQGSTYPVTTFVLRHKIVLSAAAKIDDTELSVSPLAHNIASGTVLTFGEVSVTTTANAAIGDRTLSVVAITQDLSKGLTARGDLVDLTGFSARASIRAQYSDDSPIASFTCDIPSPATNGEVTITMSSSTTSGLIANIAPGRADDIADFQANSFPSATEQKLFYPGLSAYYWDLETYNSDTPPIVQRWIHGRVLVTSEATR